MKKDRRQSDMVQQTLHRGQKPTKAINHSHMQLQSTSTYTAPACPLANVLIKARYTVLQIYLFIANSE